MGCEESRTTGDEPKREPKCEQGTQQKEGENLIVRTLTGLLEKNLNFQDCLIESESDLENKIRMYIPTTRPDENNPNKFAPNIQDDIVTKSLELNYSEFSIIAMSGVNINYVSNVKEPCINV